VLLIWLLNFVNYFLTPSRTSSFAAILKSTASFSFVELWKQYRSTVEFNVVDSTVLINLGDPCKRAFSELTSAMNQPNYGFSNESEIPENFGNSSET
jgi:hypothetical protein